MTKARYFPCIIFSACLLTTFLTGISFGAEASDSDFDGVSDDKDLCPETARLIPVSNDFKYRPALDPKRLSTMPQAWPVDKQGCELDQDQDGVINSRDYCPDNTILEISQGVAANGCPRQSDADGTPDYRDRCPNTAPGTKTDRYGCPTSLRASPSQID